ncbi:nucleotide exchange factor GrpE [Coralloluteibacterium thermophilus]|uniref:Protein GrpE n=1 Tax=Coralloluteibacterium thermophilum TaxID=2707049 RepID=A0ABV9NIF4_9GAMM
MQHPENEQGARTPYDDIPKDQENAAEQAGLAEDAAAGLAAAREEIARLREDGLRERAELENQRRRMSRDLEQARRFANERLLAELLPVFDSLEAGLAAVPEAGPVRDGLELTLRQLQKVTGEHGLSVVDPAGQPFDPEHHQAIGVVDPAGHAPNTVVQVAQKGYVLNTRLLRPALVLVARDGD